MKLNKNKYVPIGMVFLILAIVLNKTSNISDLVVGILFGISIGVLTVGIIISKKQISGCGVKGKIGFKTSN